LTLVLSERDVLSLIDMGEVVSSVEEAFRREGLGEATNSMRTRSRGGSSVLNVMHANLAYLKRGGLKAYMSSRAGTKFVLVLFDNSDSTPLAVMGADTIGRFRTGAASGVATKYLYGAPSGTLALFGSGKQALTQALAMASVMSLEDVRVWSPTAAHRESCARLLRENGLKAHSLDSPLAALEGAQVACAITSSKEPFLTESMLHGLSHVNICGSNAQSHAEMTPAAVGSFDTVVVDDLAQARVEYGDLIMAESSGRFAWESAVDLASVVAGRTAHHGRTLFKSGGIALEDVAVASALYDKAMKSGEGYSRADFR
jgi:ornithine cyclodeaminase/alanine dehydrogenase-like protein (mu-crystallin family)